MSAVYCIEQHNTTTESYQKSLETVLHILTTSDEEKNR